MVVGSRSLVDCTNNISNYGFRCFNLAEMKKTAKTKLRKSQQAMRTRQHKNRMHTEKVKPFTPEEEDAIGDDWDRELLGDDAIILEDHDIGNK